ncbi:MAG: hypothetical protein KAT56_09495 [Sedimentisphaerales bacterium]|nr:hypothetical protein [Sedimentisphaerales bacterium]
MKKIVFTFVLIIGLVLCGSLQADLVNGDFEADPFLTGWTETVPTKPAQSHIGIAPGSNQAVVLTGTYEDPPSNDIFQQGAPLAYEWVADFYLALADQAEYTGPPESSRSIALILSNASEIQNYDYAINMKITNSTEGQFNFYDGSWNAVGSGNEVSFSVDENKDGDFSDAGDTLNVHRMRIVGHNWGMPGVNYDVLLSAANSDILLPVATGLTYFQVGAPDGSSVLNSDMTTIAFRTQWGMRNGHPFVVDDVQFMANPDFNFAPSVDAGDYQSILWQATSVTVQLDATVTDDGNPADPCEVTITWSQISGPVSVSFDPSPNVEDPCVTFDTAGMYELQLRGDDGEKDACDVVTIYVRANDDPIAHWDFEESPGGSDVFDTANNNDGVIAGDSEPNWVDDGWVGDKAMEFFGVGDSTTSSYVNVTTDDTIDPNLDNLRCEISLSAWIKVDEIQSAYPVIIADGDNSWRMGLMTGEPVGRLYVSYEGTTGTNVYSTTLLNDNNWHHVAGVYDGSMAYVYVDGILEGSSERTGLIDINDLPVTIGARATSATEVERSWNGLIDDVRVYSYGISAAQVLELVAMGQGTVPTVAIETENQTVVYMQNGAFQLDATVTDDTPPQATLAWTQESGPGTATFDPCNIEDPCVTFSEAGTYVLRLTASDPLGNVFDEVTLIVENPTCQDIIEGEWLIMGDLSGPEGSPDCYVDLYDFAVLAGNWLRCNDPQNPGCEFQF